MNHPANNFDNQRGLTVRRHMAGAARYSLRLMLLLLFTLLIIFALLTAVLRLGSPFVSSYKDEMQAWASDYLRAPVDIGSIDFEWGATSPRIALTDVSMQGQRQDAAPLKLDRILLDLNLLKTIFVDGWHINEITLVGADLSLEYLGDQNFKITGYEFPAADSVNSASSTPDVDSATFDSLAQNDSVQAQAGKNEGSFDVVSWLMNANRASLTNSRIKLLDRTRELDYEIAGINVIAENSADLHQLRLELQLPGQLGEQLEIDLDLVGKSTELADSKGKFYVRGDKLQLQNWMQLWPDRSLELIGQSDLQVWGEWSGNELDSVSGRLNGEELTLNRLQSGADVGSGSSVDEASTTGEHSTELRNLTTDVNWRRQDSGWIADIDRLSFSHAGVVNELENAALTVSDSEQQRFWNLDTAGNQLDLGFLTALTSTLQDVLPLGNLPVAVASMNPSGMLHDWQLTVDRGIKTKAGAVPVVSLHGTLANLAANQYRLIPSVNGLNASVSVTDNTGSVDLQATDLQVMHKSVFPQGLDLDDVSASLALKWTEREFSLSTSDLLVSEGGLRSATRLQLQKLPLQTARLDLQGDFSLADITEVPALLPTGVMRKPLVKWFERALLKGSVSNGKLLMAGDIAEFPFAWGDGLLQANMDIDDATLEFRSDWPAVTDIDGRLELSGSSLQAYAERADFDGIPIRHGRTTISNLFRPVAVVSATSSGPLQQYIDSANNGPMAYLLKPAFAGSTGDGNASVEIAVVSPLRDPQWRDKGEKFSMAGRIQLQDNNLESELFGVNLQRLGGAVNFSHDGFEIAGLQADYLGQPVTIEGHSSGRGRKRISELNLSGVASAANMLENYGIPLAGFFNGKSRWNVNVEIPHFPQTGGGVRLTASSDLLGTAVELPVPLDKTSGLKRRVIVSSTFDPDSADTLWNLTYGSSAAARVSVGPGDTGMRSLQLQLGGGPVEPAAGRDADGIRITGATEKLAFDGWITAVNRIIEELPAGGSPEPILAVSANLDVEHFLIGNTSEGPANLRINTDDTYVNGAVNNAYLRGNIRIPRTHWDKSKPILARIAYAEKKLIDDLVESSDDGESEPLDPTAFPRLNVHLAKFKWDKLLLSDVRFRSEPEVSGMRVTTLGFAHDHAQMTGTGYWRWRDPQNVNSAFAGQQVSHLGLQILSDDMGGTVSYLGFSDALAEGRGTVDIGLDWQGPLYAPELNDLTGDIKLALRKGRILKVEPGAARVFGLFALQSLPRRLTLDFNDIVRDGLDYNRINGELQVLDGEVVSKLVQLEGPVGVIDVTGSSNFVDQTYDQRITVLPRISGALPLIGVISGGATAGIGALIAGPLLKALGLDIDKIGLKKYSLTGSWEEPVIK